MTSLSLDKGLSHEGPGTANGGQPPAFPGLSPSVVSALELAVVLAGDVTSGTSIVAEAVRSRPKAATGSHSAARADLIGATAEISALHRFSDGVEPLERWTGRTDLSRRDLVLAWAFACRLGWQAQALFWSVDVTRLHQRTVRRSLGRSDLAVDLVRDELRQGYLELRSEPDEACTEALRQAFRRATTKEPTPDGHLATCERCRSEATWLTKPAAVLERFGATLLLQADRTLHVQESGQTTAHDGEVARLPSGEPAKVEPQAHSRRAPIGRALFVMRRGIGLGGRRRSEEPKTTARPAGRAISHQNTAQILPATDHLLFVRLDRPSDPASPADDGAER